MEDKFGQRPAEGAASDRGPRLRILIGAETFPPNVNGAARFGARLAARLTRLGHEVHVIAPSTSFQATTARESHEGAEFVVHRLRSVRWPLHDWLRFPLPAEVLVQVRKVIDAVEPDIVHLQSAVYLNRGVEAAALARDIPVVITNHLMPENMIDFTGIPSSARPAAIRAGWRYLAGMLRRADAVTSPTPVAARYLEEHTGVRGVIPLSCGIDLSLYPFRISRPDEDLVVYLGRLDPEKNLPVLVSAFVAVHLARPDAHLRLLGDGAEREMLQDQIAQAGLAGAARIDVGLTDAEVRRALASATVFVMPSTAELQSISTLEALATGVPVVAADAMALPHLVVDGSDGRLAPPGDVAAFASAIADVLGLDEPEYTAMRVAARTMAEKHDADRVTAQYVSLYRRTIVEHEAALARA